MNAYPGAIIEAGFSREDVRRLIDRLVVTLIDSSGDDIIPITIRLDGGDPRGGHSILDRPEVYLSTTSTIFGVTGTVLGRYAR